APPGRAAKTRSAKAWADCSGSKEFLTKREFSLAGNAWAFRGSARRAKRFSRAIHSQGVIGNKIVTHSRPVENLSQNDGFRPGAYAFRFAIASPRRRASRPRLRIKFPVRGSP